jgi:hypothetical protein
MRRDEGWKTLKNREEDGAPMSAFSIDSPEEEAPLSEATSSKSREANGRNKEREETDLEEVELLDKSAEPARQLEEEKASNVERNGAV